MFENQRGKCRESAIRILTRRPHGKLELKEKLKRKYSIEYVEDTLLWCENLGYLQEESFLKWYIKVELQKSKSLFLIKKHLLKLGYAEDDFSIFLEDHETKIQENEYLKKIITKKLKDRNFSDLDQKERIKIIRHLLSKGFSYSKIKEEIKNMEDFFEEY